MSNAKLIRRTIGGICLLAALVMLAIGETRADPNKSALNFLVYWLVCGGLAVVAMIIAIIDLRFVRLEAREAQRALFEDTLQEIEAEKKRRASRVNPAHDNDLKD